MKSYAGRRPGKPELELEATSYIYFVAYY